VVEFSAEGEEFRADGFGGFELHESAVMEEAEFSGGFVAKHAAAAAVGELVVAAGTAAGAGWWSGAGVIAG
jgi:hypothetical protein